MKPSPIVLLLLFVSVVVFSCKNKSSVPSKEIISELELKRGNVISCGAANEQFGIVDFDMTCAASTKKDFNLAVELLHSFEYDEAEKVFAKVIDESPNCAMAYWGAAMCNFHPLWSAPTEAELQKGAKAIAIANSITTKSDRESLHQCHWFVL